MEKYKRRMEDMTGLRQQVKELDDLNSKYLDQVGRQLASVFAIFVFHFVKKKMVFPFCIFFVFCSPLFVRFVGVAAGVASTQFRISIFPVYLQFAPVLSRRIWFLPIESFS